MLAKMPAPDLTIAATVQSATGIVPEYVVVPLPLYPLTLTSVDPLFAVTVQE